MTREREIICKYCGCPVDPSWNDEWGKDYHDDCKADYLHDQAKDDSK